MSDKSIAEEVVGILGDFQNGLVVEMVEQAERIKQLESELEELKQKASTVYKLKCECAKCGHVWVERMEKE